MNRQYFEEQSNSSDNVEGTEKATNDQDVNSDPLGDRVPADAAILSRTPMGETITHETPSITNAVPLAALLDREESQRFRTRWNEIQGKFVDEPRTAVQQADKLVDEVVEQISNMFTKEHDSLVSQWKQGNDVSTEDLRKALQRYRSFFNRLVV